MSRKIHGDGKVETNLKDAKSSKNLKRRQDYRINGMSVGGIRYQKRMPPTRRKVRSPVSSGDPYTGYSLDLSNHYHLWPVPPFQGLRLGTSVPQGLRPWAFLYHPFGVLGNRALKGRNRRAQGASPGS